MVRFLKRLLTALGQELFHFFSQLLVFQLLVRKLGLEHFRLLCFELQLLLHQ